MPNPKFDIESVIGVDFGTSFCSASRINPDTQKPEVITFVEDGNVKMPSVVYIEDDNTISVGSGPAKQLERISRMPNDFRTKITQRTLVGVKRLMKPDVTFCGQSHIDITTAILSKIKSQCEASCRFNKSIEGIVLTHPVEFEEWKVEMLKTAMKRAGFKKYKLLLEPEAAALYALKSGIVPSSARGILVYDFGGGTFDTAYLYKEADGTLCHKVESQGDSQCGGSDIDKLLYTNWEHFVKETKNRSISTKKGIADMQFLKQCEDEKILLSQMTSIPCSELLPPIDNQLVCAERTITRQDFNDIITPVIEKTIAKTRILVNDIKTKNLPLDCVILIGGSSRIPLVKEKVQELVGDSVEIRTTGLTDVAVALGALYSIAPNPLNVEQKVTERTKHFCIYCGYEIWSNEKFCVRCGRPNYSYKP